MSNRKKKSGGLSRGQYLKLIRKGKKVYKEGKWEEALNYFWKAWSEGDRVADVNTLTVISDLLVKVGKREQSLTFLQKAVDQYGESAEICQVSATLASHMGMYDIAEKLLRRAIEMDPSSPVYYNNLASAMEKQGRCDEAIDMLQQVIPVFPDNSDLWNVLGVIVNHHIDGRTARQFYEEALRLSPDSLKVVNNMALISETVDEGVEITERAIEIDPTNPEPHLGMSHYMFHLGNMKRGWEEYSWREASKRKQAFGQGTHYTHNIPKWEGEDLTGKSLLVAAEQGIGDEIYFSAAIKEVADQVDHLYIGVDERLISVYQRSFPEARVVAHQNVQHTGYAFRAFIELENEIKAGELEIDYAIPVGDLCSRFWTDKDQLPQYEGGFLKADPKLVKKFQKRLAEFEDKTLVGVCWSSGNVSASRLEHYMTLETMVKGIDAKDVVFVNLHYADVKDEIAAVEESTGIQVVNWDDVDLKKDLESVFAIIECLDVVVSAGSAPAAMSFAIGTPTLVFARMYVHWLYGNSEQAGVFPHGKIFLAEKYQPWDEALEKINANIQAIAS